MFVWQRYFIGKVMMIGNGKAVKYNGILTNSVILQNVVDMTDIIAELLDEGNKITKRRYGNFVSLFNGAFKAIRRYYYGLQRCAKKC